MDEDCEIIKDNENNGNKLNISNKRAELSYIGQGRAYGVPRMESRVKVRIENREVMDTK